MNAVTLITGAAGGIGRAISHRLATDGGRLALVGRSEHSLQPLAHELRAKGADVLLVAADLSTTKGPRDAVEKTVAHYGRLDSVVSNAGVMVGSRITDLSDEDFDRSFEVNTRATFILAKAAYPHLVESQGAMVVTGSVAADNASPFGVYSATKAAVLMLVQLLAREWGPDGVRVNAVSPGMIMTPMSPAAGNESMRTWREGRIPLGRMGDPDDIAGVVAFLLSADAGYITGENITVDGGVRGNFMSGVIGIG